MSKIFNRDDWSNWMANGEKTVYERAHEFVERSVAGYRDMEPVLSADLCRELDNILAEAYKEVEGR